MYLETNEIVGINFKTNVCIVYAFGSARERYTYESKLIFYRSSRQGQLKYGSVHLRLNVWTGPIFLMLCFYFLNAKGVLVVNANHQVRYE